MRRIVHVTPFVGSSNGPIKSKHMSNFPYFDQISIGNLKSAHIKTVKNAGPHTDG